MPNTIMFINAILHCFVLHNEQCITMCNETRVSFVFNVNKLYRTYLNICIVVCIQRIQTIAVCKLMRSLEALISQTNNSYKVIEEAQITCILVNKTYFLKVHKLLNNMIC